MFFCHTDVWMTYVRCVWCLRSDRLGWLSGASGAREGLTSLQMLLHISEAGHLIINPQCIIKPICVCAHVFVPTFQGFPNSVYATLFHLTLSISPWTTSSRSQMAGLWSALCCNKLVPLFFFFRNFGLSKLQGLYLKISPLIYHLCFQAF